MAHLSSMCCSFILNPQVILYDGHARDFYDRLLNTLWIHHIQNLILKASNYVHDQPNEYGPNFILINLDGNTRMNWTRKHGTLKFTMDHMNDVLFETW